MLGQSKDQHTMTMSTQKPISENNIGAPNRVGTRKCVCTHGTRHLGVSVRIVKVIGGYGHGTQNCGCVAPLHGHGNPLQQVVVRQRLSSLHLKTVPQL